LLPAAQLPGGSRQERRLTLRVFLPEPELQAASLDAALPEAPQLLCAA
jgi:hypothetical protein